MKTKSLKTRSLRNLISDERGLSTVEYIILLVLVAVMSITAWKTFGDRVRTTVGDSTTSIQNNVDGTNIGGGAAH
jgi:Flp pilus assembly pilin Flp